MTRADSPRDMYSHALEERQSKNPITRRQACEKGYLAALVAVDEYLKRHGFHINRGHPEAHTKRDEALEKVALIDPVAIKIMQDLGNIKENLHGACFYRGVDGIGKDIVLKEIVRALLDDTGF